MIERGAGRLTIGRDLDVCRLGFGAMRVTGPGAWGPPADRASAIAVLEQAIELGIDFIDTADAYGPGISEELIADALFPYPSGLTIATKGGFVRPGPSGWVPDGRPAHLRAALEASLRRLRLACIDLYQFHHPDPTVPFAESVGALADLQHAGKIRHLGLSNVTVAQLAEARAIVRIVAVQNRYNLEDRSSDAVLAVCERDGLAFLPWAPIGGIGGPTHAVVQRIAAARGATPAQIALAWLLRRSPVMLPIPGTASPTHLAENVAAGRIALGDDDLRALDAA